MASDFQTAKSAMLKKFKENKYGPWVSKPVEEEMFCQWDALALHLQNKPIEVATWRGDNSDLQRQSEAMAFFLFVFCSMLLRLAMCWLSLVLQTVRFVRNGNTLVRSKQNVFALNYFILAPFFEIITFFFFHTHVDIKAISKRKLENKQMVLQLCLLITYIFKIRGGNSYMFPLDQLQSNVAR